MDIQVQPIPTAASYPLRHAVLRPHQSLEDVVWEGDDDPGTTTFGAIDADGGAIVGVTTVFRQPAPFDPVVAGVDARDEAVIWRLRGMATREDLRGAGIGTMVLEAALDHVAAEGGLLIWCNARLGAVGFYERAAFERWGEEWVLPSIGPHVVMWRRIERKRAQ